MWASSAIIDHNMQISCHAKCLQQVLRMQLMIWSKHAGVVGHKHTALHSFLATQHDRLRHWRVRISVMPTEYLRFL